MPLTHHTALNDQFIAGLHLLRDDPAGARDLFKSILAQDEHRPAAWMALSVASRHAGDGLGAMAAIERAVALAPGHVAAQCIRAEIALELLDLSRAVAAIEACIKADPSGADPSGVRARSLLFLVKDQVAKMTQG